MEESKAGTIFGGITFVCGVVGSLAGGVILDYTKKGGHNILQFSKSALTVIP
eukprot:UN33848